MIIELIGQTVLPMGKLALQLLLVTNTLIKLLHGYIVLKNGDYQILLLPKYIRISMHLCRKQMSIYIFFKFSHLEDKTTCEIGNFHLFNSDVDSRDHDFSRDFHDFDYFLGFCPTMMTAFECDILAILPYFLPQGYLNNRIQLLLSLIHI